MGSIYLKTGFKKQRFSVPVLGLVFALHAGMLFALATIQKAVTPPDEHPIFVSLLAPEPEAIAPEIQSPQVVQQMPKPVRSKPAVIPKPQKTEIVQEIETPVVSHSAEAVETPAMPASKTEASLAAESAPAAEANVPAEAIPKEEPVEQPSFNADYLDNPSPGYPSLSRKLREEGRVLLRVHVNAGGQPAQVDLHQSSGFSRLDDRALETVKRWKFVPARRGGDPVEAWVIVPIQFSLKG